VVRTKAQTVAELQVVVDNGDCAVVLQAYEGLSMPLPVRSSPPARSRPAESTTASLNRDPVGRRERDRALTSPSSATRHSRSSTPARRPPSPVGSANPTRPPNVWVVCTASSPDALRTATEISPPSMSTQLTNPASASQCGPSASACRRVRSTVTVLSASCARCIRRSPESAAGRRQARTAGSRRARLRARVCPAGGYCPRREPGSRY